MYYMYEDLQIHIFHMLILLTMKSFALKLRHFLQLFHCTFPVYHHSTSQTIKKQVVIQDTS